MASSSSSAKITIQNPTLLSVETALNMAYGEKLLDEIKPFDPYTSTVSDEAEKRNRNPNKHENSEGDDDDDDDSSSSTSSSSSSSESDAIDVDKEEQKQQEESKLIFRTDTALWFVPDFHPIEIVGISADPVSKKLYCTIKMEQDEGAFSTTAATKKENSEEQEQDGGDDENSEESSPKNVREDEQRRTRMIVAPLSQVRKHFPQLLIDHLLYQAVYEQ